MDTIIIILLSIALLYVCYTDMKERTITNITVIIVFILSLALSYFYTKEFNWIASLSILVIGFILSLLGFVGAGDVKLLVALSISLNCMHVLNLFILMSMFGIPVALIAFLVHKFKKKTERCEVPYGVAISLGYMVTLLTL